MPVREEYAIKLSLEEHLCFSIYQANLAIQRSYKPGLDQLGITYPQYLALCSLWERDNQTVGQLAGRLDLEPSTISPILKRLEIRGLVERKRLPEDERSVAISLTDKGRAVKNRAGCISHILRREIPPKRLAKLNEEVQSILRALQYFEENA